ncbi:hypothetical protein SPISAL_04275 [Spiribacter salinus M19-40]|uniref:Lipoprotein n=1 Tax=Spiribacter salinus M19-40 TaxID=1260251 RepID=R4V4S4_9GAMM|nr:alanine-zipper protein [Spiribacter salinus]AGM40949.1 hypothetical protein SPISAL_04275 [Spiribacter salinus M19-40]
MNQSMKTLLKLTIAGASLGILAGCATQASTEDLQAQIDAAMDEASRATATAEGAQRTADDNAEKIDRMFERSMYK